MRFRFGVFALFASLLMVGIAAVPASTSILSAPPATPHAAPASNFATLFAAGSHALSTRAERAAFISQLLGNSPQVLARELTQGGAKGVTTQGVAEFQTYVILHPMDTNNFINIGIGALGGCAAGGVIGAIAGSVVPGLGTAVGAGVGCVVGALAGALITAYATSAGNVVFTLKNEDAFQQQQAATLVNYNNITVGSAISALSLFNQTTYAWQSMADAVAVNQLANATFNFTLDMVTSQVPQQLETLIYGYGIAPGVMLANINQIEYSIYSTPALTGVHDGLVFGSGACMGICALGAWFGGAGSYFSATVSSGSALNIFVRPGTVANASCQASTGLAHNLVTGVNYTIPHATGTDTSTSSLSGYYRITTLSATSCAVTGTGVLNFPQNPFNGATTSVFDALCGRASIGDTNPKHTPPGGCDPLKSFDIYNTVMPDSIEPFNLTAGHAIGPTEAFGQGPIAGPFNTAFNTIEHAAMTNAFTYWQFLRAQGYTSKSQIPTTCVIPYPVQAVPNVASLNSGTTASINDTMTAYVSWMNGLATFFNAAPNATGWCHGHGIFNPGTGGTGPQFGENISGFVLTLPVGTHQKLNSPFTYAVNGSNAPWNGTTPSGTTNKTPAQLVLWPSVMSVKIPLNKVVLVAQNNPLVGYVVRTFTELTMNGNGTNQQPNGTLSNTAASSTPGVAIYLTACAIKGVNENPCVITLSNISAFLFNLSCSPNCNPTPTPTPNTPLLSFESVFCGIPLLGALCGLFGNSIGAWLSLIVLVVIVVVVAYIAYRVYVGFSNVRRRGGPMRG